MSIESEINYLKASLEALKSINGLINEFSESWKRDNIQLSLPIGLDNLRRNFELLVRSYKQCSSASATHASNIVRQLVALEGIDEKSEHLRSATIKMTYERIERSLKIIGGELGKLNERNIDVRGKIATNTNNQKLNETLNRAEQIFDKLNSIYIQLDLKSLGPTLKIDDLQKNASFKQTALNEAKVNFDKLQNSFYSLTNIDLIN